jgi:hypothetical protein
MVQNNDRNNDNNDNGDRGLASADEEIRKRVADDGERASHKND